MKKRSDWRWTSVEAGGNTVRLTLCDLYDRRRSVQLTMGVMEAKQLAEVIAHHANVLINDTKQRRG